MISILALMLQAAAAPAPVAPWTVTPRANADPSITSSVAGAPSEDGNARLVMRCDAGKVKVVSFQLFTRAPLGGPPNRVVALSMDGLTPLSDTWEFVDKGAFQRADTAVTALASALATAKSIKLHTTTAAGEPVDASFAGPASDAPIKALLAACDYTLGVLPVRADEKGKKGK